MVRLGIGFAWLCLSKCGNGPPARLGGTGISPVVPMAGGKMPAPPVVDEPTTFLRGAAMNAMSVLSAELSSSLEREPRSFVISLGRVRSADAPRVGGKGANLGEMRSAGLPVPSGFCVTTAAFRQFMAACPDNQQLWDALAALQLPGIEAVQSVGGVRQRLADTATPPAVEQAIVAAWEAQGTLGAYAGGRAPRPRTGPDASFAGQGETFLNSCGRQAILQSVRDCWISLFTDRAILYRMHTGVDHCTSAMAVVVQSLIVPHVSGVLFTADPVTGNPQRIVIEAAYGLGVALVSGQLSPDRFVLSRPGLHVIERQLGNKKRGGGGGCRVRRASTAGHAADGQAACLDGPTTRRLGALALQAERALARPRTWNGRWPESGCLCCNRVPSPP